MAQRQVKSRQRVVEHGEVFTAEREVKAMCDLVKGETERIDSRFLEPACGEGAFLTEILRRKLEAVKRQYGKNPAEYQRYSVLAVSSLYGVDLLKDNAAVCRQNLYQIWDEAYTAQMKDRADQACRRAVRFILGKNIVCGNALDLLCSDGSPIRFAEWNFVTGDLIKRRDFRLDVLLRENADETSYERQMSLFGENPSHESYWQTDPVTHEKIPKPVEEFPLMDYRRLGEDE